MEKDKLLATTESVCPECLKVIPARKVANGQGVFLVKECADHGEFRTLIWDGEPDYQGWNRERLPVKLDNWVTPVDKGCPYDCGPCPEHRQEPCCVLLEVTQNCNLNCPICFASAGATKSNNPSLIEIMDWYRWLLEHGGPYNIHLSGGEPTVRKDLPEIVWMGKQLGFPYLQLNTNGLRLAREPELVKELKEAGLDCVYLQFDGTREEIYQKIRGRALLREKMKAIEHCAREGLGVALVPTLVPGINTDNIGAIIEFALSQMPYIRGVHFQPVSYFGRYPGSPPEKRVTIPQILREIEQQTGGKIKKDNFAPVGAENAYCTFHGNFTKESDGTLKPWRSAGCCPAPAEPVDPRVGVAKSRSFIARQWSAPPPAGSCCNRDPRLASLDEFLQRVKTNTISISGMAFQDAWNLDLERLRDCKLYIFSPEGKLIPFCAYNLTAKNGQSIYRPQWREELYGLTRQQFGSVAEREGGTWTKRRAGTGNY